MRNTIAKSIELASLKQFEKQEATSAHRRNERQALRQGLPLGTTPVEHPDDTHSENDMAVLRPIMGQQVFNRRLSVKRLLGQYLVDAARLHQAMSTYRDQQMLDKYLYNDPPLHPRRTLDQSYYWALKTTSERDRDQVVFRGTSMNLETRHRLHQTIAAGKKKTAMETAAGRSLQSGAGDGELQWQWTSHSEKTDHNGCHQCRTDIRKTSQILVVDQLWMVILDERTIITAFPKRYGFNKHDLSGVHRSIRARLQSARKNQIRSVYDLALIILDECSNTVFDRIKTKVGSPEPRPGVLLI